MRIIILVYFHYRFRSDIGYSVENSLFFYFFYFQICDYEAKNIYDFLNHNSMHVHIESNTSFYYNVNFFYFKFLTLHY